MNTALAHLQMTVYLVHGHTPAPHPTPTPSGHRSSGHGSGLFDSFVRSGVNGAGWAGGSRLMHALPIGVVILIAGVALAVFLLRKRGSKKES